MLRSCAMPNTRSAAKRVRADVDRRQRNLKVISELRTLTRKFQKLVKEGQKGPAGELYRALAKKFDMAASKEVIHRNTASRKKARLARSCA